MAAVDDEPTGGEVGDDPRVQLVFHGLDAGVEGRLGVVVGDGDPSTPPAAARFIHEHVAGSQLAVLADAAHLSNVEQPAAFNDALLPFVGAHR